jgi:hypothetical protein
VIGLVFTLVACCPFASLAGAIIGALAYRRIVASGGAMRGRRVALAAMFAGIGLGLASGLGWSWALSSMDRWMRDSAIGSIEKFMLAVQTGDSAAALRMWEPAQPAPSVEALARFGQLTGDRFGGFREFRITSLVPGGSAFSRRVAVAGTFVFESAQTPGSAELVFAQTTSFWPALRLSALAITDAGRGEIRLPVASALPASATSPDASQSAP